VAWRKGALDIRSERGELDKPKRTQAPAPLAAWVPDDSPTSKPASVAAVSDKHGERYALPGDVAAEVRKAFEGSAYQRERWSRS
jgi:hypothetical protein